MCIYFDYRVVLAGEADIPPHSPQEAVLTSGTLRQALDINDEHTDAELHAVLKW